MMVIIKLQQLSNAALHVMLGDTPEDTLRDILVSLLDDLTVLHIKLLRFILHPGEFGVPVVDYQDLHTLKPYVAGIPVVIAEHIPEFERGDLLELCLTDLVNRGLLVIRSKEPGMQWQVSPEPTFLAREFMGFITLPKPRSVTDESQ